MGTADKKTPAHSATEQVLRLFRQRGDSQYGGEAVSQLEHALQAAMFAEQAGATPSLIVAALLHDVGHLLHRLADDAPDHGVDDRHEALAAAWLKARFGPAVVEPVRLHVAAKRYLCAVDPEYRAQLSPPSAKSLALQGGPLAQDEIETFEAGPFFASAVQLRRWDEAAKVVNLRTPDLEHFCGFLDLASRESPPCL